MRAPCTCSPGIQCQPCKDAGERVLEKRSLEELTAAQLKEREYQRQYRIKHRDKKTAYMREWRVRHRQLYVSDVHPLQQWADIWN